MRQMRRLITVCCLKAKYDSEYAEFHQRLAWLAYRKLLGVKYMPKLTMPRLVNRRRTLDSFDEIDCWAFFKFRKTDLPRVLRVLRLPESCTLSNGIRMSGEEISFRGMYELVSGEDQHNISSNVFGRDQSAQSRAFSYFINHIYETFLDLVTDNVGWWIENGYVEQSRQAIERKLEDLGLIIANEIS